MNQNYQSLDAGTFTSSKKRKRSVQKPPFGLSGFKERYPGWPHFQNMQYGMQSFITAGIFLLLLLFNVDCFAQGPAKDYTFFQATETYSAVTGTASTAIGDDGTQEGINIGFNFIFDQTTYTTFSITTNGMIRMGGSAIGSGWTNSLGNSATLRPVIAPFWDDNNAAGGTVVYAVTGAAPNRVLEVGWNNINIGGGGSESATNKASYKLRLYETTNVIEFVYGPTMATAGTLTASVGINGSASFLSVTPAATSTVSFATANNSIGATTNLVGKLFRFSPPVFNSAPNCVATPTAPTNGAANITANTFSWPSATGGATGYKFYLGTDAQATNLVNGTTQTATTYTYASMLPGTTYYWKAVPYNNAGDAASCTTWSFTTASLPACLSTFAPANSAVSSNQVQRITWAAVAGATSYDVYYGTTATPALIGNQAGLTYSPSAQTANGTYYWKVVPKNTFGSAINCVTNTFTMGAVLYCSPTTTNGCTDGDVIARVQLNTLDNNSGTGCPSGTAGYSDYTSNPSLTTTLQAGTSYSCTVYAGQYSEGYAAWIDYNDNGTFETSERIGFSNGQVTGSGAVGVLGSSASFPIVLACNPPVGVHRLRVRAMFNISGSSVTPCGNNSYGEIEDYLVTITEAAACPQPSGLTAAGVTATTANLSWTLGCAETAWEVLVQPATQGAPTSGSAGSAVVATTYQAQGLMAGTPYHFYVRANCGATDGVSLWTGPGSFTTSADAAPLCATITNPANAATGVVLGANASVTLSWTAAATGQAATSYDVYVGESADELQLLGTTANTTLNVTGFSGGETYYWKIAPKNSFGAAADCSVWSFSTFAGPADTCATALDLAALGSPFTGTTTGASNNYHSACDESTESVSPDKIYYIDVPANYTLVISQTANEYDSVIYAGYGGACPGTTAIACFDEPDTAITTWVNLTGSTQRVYWVQDGYEGDAGSFTITYELQLPPDCLAPTAVNPGVSGTTANISFTASESAPENGYEYEVRSDGDVLSGSTGLLASGTTLTTSIPAVTGLTIGESYTVHVRSLCSETISSIWNSLTFLVPVANDYCSGAITIACGNTYEGSTAGATNDNMAVCGIPSFTTQNTAGVWYTFSGDGSDVTISTCSANSGDTRMAIYTGACGALTCVGGNDDNSACEDQDLSSEVLLSTVNGTAYHILIYAYGTGSSSAATVGFDLSMSCIAPCSPATGNDNCATAAVVTVGSSLASNNTCSTPSTGVAYPSCGSQFATYYDTWYTFNSGSNTTLEVSVAASTTSTGYIVYGGSCGSFTPLLCNATGTATNVNLTANTNYFVRVYTNGAAGRGNFTLSVKVPCPRPTAVTATNVDITAATISWTASTPAAAGGYQYEVRLSGAAGSGATGLAFSGTSAGVTVPVSGLAAETQYSVYVRSVCSEGDYSPWTASVTFTTLPACLKPTAVNYTALTYNSVTLGWTAPAEIPADGYQWELRTTGAAGSGNTGLFATSVTTGTSVNVPGLNAATGYSVYVRSDCGDVNSAWTTVVSFTTPPAPPANDLCTGAAALTCGGSIAGSTIGATTDNMAVCGISGVTVQNTPGVWYKYVSDGTDVTFSTCATGTGDTRLAVFTGACGSMTCVGGNDDNSACTVSTLSSEATISDTTAGTTYYILVYAYATAGPSTSTVSFTVSATCAPACAPVAGNNECAAAQTLALGTTTATNNSCASASLGFSYPTCGPSSFATYYDTWYKFNTGVNTAVVLTIAVTSPAVVQYAVYSGTCSALEQIACSTGGSIQLNSLTPHTVYYLRAYSTSKAARGNFSLQLEVPCIAPTAVTVVNDATTATLSWSAAATPPSNGYRYEIRTTGAAGSGASGLVTSGTSTGLTAMVTGLTANTNYTAYLGSVCNASWSTWTTGTSFYTGHCIPAPTSGSGNGITNVTFGTVNNTTGAESGNYGNFSSLTGIGTRNAELTVSVTSSTANYVKIWVDWNNDNDFADTGEQVYASAAAEASTQALFTIPSSSTLGDHRMRIGAGTASTFTPCHTGAGASFEDYTLNVISMGVAFLTDTYCNSTVSNFATKIYSVYIPEASAYRFRVASPTNVEVLQTTARYFSINMLASYSYGVTYMVDVSVNINGVWSDYGTACKVTTAGNVPTSQLKICGGTVNSFDSYIYAETVQLASTYRFEVVSGASTVTLDRPAPWFKLNMLPTYNYGTVYTVRVMVLANGQWSVYGAPCTVSAMAEIAQTKLKVCGQVVSSFTGAIYADLVPLATTYSFTVVSPYGTEVITSSQASFSLSQLTNYDYNENYSVTVTATVPGAGTSTPGASCVVTSPAQPVTSIKANQCGTTISTRATGIYCTTVPKTVTYRFTITKPGGAVQVLNRTAGSFNINMLTGIAAGATFGVVVQTISPNGSMSAAGPSCNITLSAFAARPGAPVEAHGDAPGVKLAGFPNPFIDSFGLDFTTNSDAQVDIVIYDMTGKLVDKRTVQVSQLPELRVGENFAAGVYNLILTQGDTVKTLRVVKNTN